MYIALILPSFTHLENTPGKSLGRLMRVRMCRTISNLHGQMLANQIPGMLRIFFSRDGLKVAVNGVCFLPTTIGYFQCETTVFHFNLNSDL